MEQKTDYFVAKRNEFIEWGGDRDVALKVLIDSINAQSLGLMLIATLKTDKLRLGRRLLEETSDFFYVMEVTAKEDGRWEIRAGPVHELIATYPYPDIPDEIRKAAAESLLNMACSEFHVGRRQAILDAIKKEFDYSKYTIFLVDPTYVLFLENYMYYPGFSESLRMRAFEIFLYGAEHSIESCIENRMTGADTRAFMEKVLAEERALPAMRMLAAEKLIPFYIAEDAIVPLIKKALDLSFRAPTKYFSGFINQCVVELKSKPTAASVIIISKLAGDDSLPEDVRKRFQDLLNEISLKTMATKPIMNSIGDQKTDTTHFNRLRLIRW